MPVLVIEMLLFFFLQVSLMGQFNAKDKTLTTNKHFTLLVHIRGPVFYHRQLECALPVSANS